MKKIYLSILLFVFLIGGVAAQDYYFENSNGVILNEEEYDRVSQLYWEGYQDDLTIDEYNFLKDNGVFENEIVTDETSDNNNNSNINLLSTAYTTSYKSLKISKVCSTNCIVVVTLSWLIMPTVRSYDILGFYLNNVTVLAINNLTVATNNGKESYSYTKKATNGIGTSFKLPSDATSLKMSQTITVENKGTINASYQHATKSISYANSKKYSFSQSGVGGVFSFESGIKDYYDRMNGVKLTLG